MIEKNLVELDQVNCLKYNGNSITIYVCGTSKYTMSRGHSNVRKMSTLELKESSVKVVDMRRD
jgi:hypothetical protein